MNSADDDKLEEYAQFAITLRKVHESADGSAMESLYLTAAEVIEDLILRAKEAREDF
ncbi:MAG: hypothetical protein JO322_07220 [Candidatus Eremiobacteraeota bacterium]|nr:hypothetical protein [Candidatus Eremiobacteraeota bacterium]